MFAASCGPLVTEPMPDIPETVEYDTVRIEYGDDDLLEASTAQMLIGDVSPIANITQGKDYTPVPLSSKEEEIRRGGGIFAVGRREFRASVDTPLAGLRLPEFGGVGPWLMLGSSGLSAIAALGFVDLHRRVSRRRRDGPTAAC